MLRLVAAVLLSLVSIAAAPQSVSTKAERLASATGLQDMLIAAQKTSTDSAAAMTQSILTQYRRAGIPDAIVDALAPRLNESMQKVVQAWDPAVASRLYSESLSAALSDKDLDDAEAYYSSEQGKKTLGAVKQSQTKLQTYIQTRTSEVLETEMAALIVDLKAIIAEQKKSASEKR